MPLHVASQGCQKNTFVLHTSLAHWQKDMSLFILHYAFGCCLLASQGKFYIGRKASYVLHMAPFCCHVFVTGTCTVCVFLCIFAETEHTGHRGPAPDVRVWFFSVQVIWPSPQRIWWTSFGWSIKVGSTWLRPRQTMAYLASIRCLASWKVQGETLPLLRFGHSVPPLHFSLYWGLTKHCTKKLQRKKNNPGRSLRLKVDVNPNFFFFFIIL